MIIGLGGRDIIFAGEGNDVICGNDGGDTIDGGPGDDRAAGNLGRAKPAFFAYMYPKPKGFEDAVVSPEAARWNADVGEFLLDYDDVRMAEDPRAAILAFADSAYEAGATFAGWDPELLDADRPSESGP